LEFRKRQLLASSREDIVSSRGHGPWTSGERVRRDGSEKGMASRFDDLEASLKVNLITKETW
jgi:hypothetical protein